MAWFRGEWSTAAKRNIAFGGVYFGAIGVWVGYQAYRMRIYKVDPPAANQTSVFDNMTSSYTSITLLPEYFLGLNFARRWNITKVEGDVLELCCGLGANLPFYKYDKLNSLTMTDVSRSMVEQAENFFYEKLNYGSKYSFVQMTFAVVDNHCLLDEGATRQQRDPAPAEQPHSLDRVRNVANAFWSYWQRKFLGQSDDNNSTVTPTSKASTAAPAFPSTATTSIAERKEPRWEVRCRNDATEAGVPLTHFKRGSFDWVVSTFGLCSVEDPVQVLRQAAAVLRPGGNMLLVEHGLSNRALISTWLNKKAPRHFKRWGCWCNRDIMEIVEKADLEVKDVKVWVFGCIYILVVAPRRAASELRT